MEIVRLPRIKGDYYITTCCIYDCLATICNCYGEKIEWIFYDYLNVKYKRTDSAYTYNDLDWVDPLKTIMWD